MPDWGPADVGTGPGRPDPGKPDPGKPGSGAPGALSVQAPASVKRGTLRRRGLKLTVTAPQAGTAAATLRAGRKVVARRTRALPANAATVLRLKPKRWVPAQVRRLRLRLAVGPQVQTRTIVLRG